MEEFKAYFKEDSPVISNNKNHFIKNEIYSVKKYCVIGSTWKDIDTYDYIIEDNKKTIWSFNHNDFIKYFKRVDEFREERINNLIKK